MVGNTKYAEQASLRRKSRNLNDLLLGFYCLSCVTGYSVIAIGYPPAVLKTEIEII